ncbi:oxidoreductase [Lithospermum erythrorhizon]|uniref:Oxidoreductase n=1 Tax=Lithospermum erythrorhizon TaxID=34254 RepID=A0AAV3R5H6_LITER
MAINKSAKLYVAGYSGLVSSAVVLILAEVDGIHANATFPGDFLIINLQIQTNVITSSISHNVKKLVFHGSFPTNEWYAIVKISGMKTCEAYKIQNNFNAISLMPTNLYGPNDNFHPENSHVLPGLLRRFHEAKMRQDVKVVVWGSVSPLREFLHVDDLADVVVFCMEEYDGLEYVNVGGGKEVGTKELAELVKEVVGSEGEIVWDGPKPDGTPRKLMDSSKLAKMGWEAKTSLRDGLVDTYKWYLENVKQ